MSRAAEQVARASRSCLRVWTREPGERSICAWTTLEQSTRRLLTWANHLPNRRWAWGTGVRTGVGRRRHVHNRGDRHDAEPAGVGVGRVDWFGVGGLSRHPLVHGAVWRISHWLVPAPAGGEGRDSPALADYLLLMSVGFVCSSTCQISVRTMLRADSVCAETASMSPCGCACLKRASKSSAVGSGQPRNVVTVA